MSLFATFEELGAYVDKIKGYKYLDNPADWIDALKEVVGNSTRNIEIEGDPSLYYFNPNGWDSLTNWTTAGEYIETGLDGGLKSLPVVENIITDTTTGATVAGAAAVATEATGITVSLSVAGWLATGLVSLGLGVAAYEVAPEFWTDLSNAVFEPITGHHLTYDETEPFLRKKINTLLSTDDNGHIVTYVDRDMMERMYNFIQTHIQENGWDVYDAAGLGTWQSYTPSGTYYGNYCESATRYATISFPVKTNTMSLTDDLLQSVVHQTQLMMERQGLVQAEPSVQGVVNKLHDLFPNYNNCDFYHIYYSNYYTSPTVQTRKLQVSGYNVAVTEDDEITAVLYDYGASTNNTFRFLREGVNQAQARNNDYGTQVRFKDANNIDINTRNDAYFSMEYDIDTGVAVVKDDGSSYIFQYNNTSIGYLPITYGSTNNFGYYYTTVEPQSELDDYLVAAGVEQKGNIPPKTGTFEQGYTEWFHKNKTIGTPDKNGTNKVNNYIPSNLPLTNDATDKIIKKGVNKDPDSYNDDQNSNHNGKDTPDHNPIDSVNEDTENKIKDYNDSKVDPFTAPDEAPLPLPDYPVNPPQEPGGDTGDTPDPSAMETVTASGMVSVYNPTKQQLIDFSAWLWSPNFLDNFLKIFANPMDAIIGLHIMYATPSTGSAEHIVAGYLDSGVSAKVVNNQFTEIDCGTIEIPEYYGTAIDYEPYVQIHIYLPFVGIQSLKPNDVIGKKLNVKYGVDALTGTCLATLTTKKGESEIACYNFAGNCATQIPVSGGNYAQMITGLASMAIGVGGGIATGNPMMVAGGIMAGAMGSHLDVSHSGSIGANAGAMGIRKPYLIITRKKAYDAQGYNYFYGFPANKTVILGSCSGFTRVRSVHIDSIYNATDNEKTEIEALLKQGVIIK